MLIGRCQCGRVEYAVEDAFLYAGYCHCQNCRLRTGSAFSTFAGIEPAKFEITQGAEDLTVFGDVRAGERFCRFCGSTLFALVNEGTMVHVQMGTLIDVPTVRPREHIFVGSNAPWHVVAKDGTPHYARHVSDGDLVEDSDGP
ncbi:GFA family protein [Kaistia dalseonensis]|uniref:CENP-V/GFA domain-containing protein n=1 Tax=Kaistia dalseonensis TaxID=410840 RepID=A0ABU0HCI0_9HYPH|nr:GFA family protein [Kaistia dalseonensis]MCX5497373.1 GFA family protein [Kaistia dalseonensis]MDQ0440011.1 hypothetical protein [Kaistia dalseonensis]